MEIKRDFWVGEAECVGFQNATNATISCPEYFPPEIISGVALIFDLLSILGSIFVIGTYYAYRDLRTRARLILLMISIGDLINALAYGIAFIYSIFERKFAFCYYNKPKYEISICVLQATFSNFSNNSSIIWTALLGVHITQLFFRSKRMIFINNKCFILISLFAWGIPLIVALLGLILNIFGPGSPNVTVGWCFISSYKLEPNSTSQDGQLILQLLMAKLWEMIIFLALIVAYSFSCYRVCKYNKAKRGNWRFSNSNDLRLIWIPVVFFLLKIWGNIRWVLSLFIDSCLTSPPIGSCVVDCILSLLQAIGDPGQGWANALLYVLFNGILRRRVWANFRIYCSCCCCCLRRHSRLGSILHWKYSEKSPLVSRVKKETAL